MSLTGLTPQEVIARRAAGQGNTAKIQTGRSYAQIFQENLFTFINGIFFTISLVMFLLHRPSDGVLVVVVIFGGVIVNIYQEIWAKRQLDAIALLTRPKATVIRAGQEDNIDPEEVVFGDILVLRPGDQILVDGDIVGDGRVEVDESLLTGESDLIPKQAGLAVYSGSFCVSGTACYEAQKVGAETVAYKLMSGAKAYRRSLTPLQVEINVMIRVFMLIACFLWVLVGISFLSSDYSLNEIVQRAAVIAGLVPAGLLLAITLAYGLGAVRMVGQDVLIQQANAVESLSNVDTLCLDKTGTLTTNQITLQSVLPIGIEEVKLRQVLADYAASATAGNRTSEAIAQACPGQVRTVVSEVPFASVRKWSAIAFSEGELPGSFILGAPDVLSAVSLSAAQQQHIQAQSELGLRVVLFAYNPDPTLLNPDVPALPLPLTALGILSFGDQLRPEAYETLQNFAKAGIALKIISGDNPSTVVALAKQAGLGADIKMVSGQQLAAMDDVQFAQAALTATVFGRVTPEQKSALVQSLRRAGRYVAMIGDGVNDVLSLKQANLAIAMESGSKAARGVADIVLIKDSFGSLPQAFLEGQCIRNGIQDVLKMFMIRTFCITLLIFATAIVTDSFPLQNKHSAIVALIGVGFPTMFIPVWAKPGAVPRRSMVRSILHFVIPATLSLTLVALFVYLFYLVVAILDLQPGSELAQVNNAIPRSALVAIMVMGQLMLMPFLKPPTAAWVAAEPLSGDWRYTWVAIALLGLYLFIVAFPSTRQFFELAPLAPINYLFIGLITLEWALILRFMWRSRFLDRFLGIDLE
jgi:cation-transporting P-type ATPase E